MPKMIQLSLKWRHECYQNLTPFHSTRYYSLKKKSTFWNLFLRPAEKFVDFKYIVECEVLITVTMKSTAFCVVMVCSSETVRYFGGIHLVYLQDREVRQERGQPQQCIGLHYVRMLKECGIWTVVHEEKYWLCFCGIRN